MANLILDIPDDVLKREGLTAKQMQIEVACRLFDAQKLSKFEASQLCGLTRDEFNSELLARKLPIIRYTEEMLEEDLRHIGSDSNPDDSSARGAS